MVLMSMKMPPLRKPDTMPSGPSATACTAAASVTMVNTISDSSATARGVSAQRMPAAIRSVGLVARPVPAGDGVPGIHQAGHDQLSHRAEPDESDVHASPRVYRGRNLAGPRLQPRATAMRGTVGGQCGHVGDAAHPPLEGEGRRAKRAGWGETTRVSVTPPRRLRSLRSLRRRPSPSRGGWEQATR